jgi:hypothetical protein
MHSGFEVRCANKNLNGTIVRVGGTGWSLSHHEAIYRLNSRQIRLFIFIGDESFEIGVRGDGDDAYLVIEPDAKALHDVEELQSC